MGHRRHTILTEFLLRYLPPVIRIWVTLSDFLTHLTRKRIERKFLMKNVLSRQQPRLFAEGLAIFFYLFIIIHDMINFALLQCDQYMITLVRIRVRQLTESIYQPSFS